MRSVIVVVASALLGACSLLTDLDGLSGGEAPSDATMTDAHVGDAVLETAASDDATLEDASVGPDATPLNRQPNAGFEDAPGEPGCGPGWNGYDATLTRVTTSRTGRFACQACENGTDRSTGFTIDGYDSMKGVAIAVGETWHAEAWVRLPPGLSTVQQASIHVRTYAADGTFIEGSQSAQVTLTSAWQKVAVDLQLSKPGNLLNVYIESGPAAAGNCVLGDDVVVYRAP